MSYQNKPGSWEEFLKMEKIGQLGENALRTYLEKKGHKIVTGERPTNSHDIRATDKRGTETLYEVKTDMVKSPNVFIEIFTKGKPSGLAVTKADMYVIYAKNEGLLFFCRTSVLKALIDIGGYRLVIARTDDTATKGYLIPKEEMKTQFAFETVN
jgi:hypothetical protein